MFPILGTNICPSVRAGEKQIPGSATIIEPDLKKNFDGELFLAPRNMSCALSKTWGHK